MNEITKAGKQETGDMKSIVITRLTAEYIKRIIALGEAFFAHSATRNLGLLPVRYDETIDARKMRR
ncbi:MAG: hypothetical protein A4E66_02123 [Syntrophus sp. PtaB.Bin001]|nr:MAG: hypothetical protein A4E66_02123 [Syntrophus sp. PtaB.Bin001]